MDIKDNASIKELEALKRKIEKQITAQKSNKKDQSQLYNLIKNDHERHKSMKTEGKSFGESWTISNSTSTVFHPLPSLNSTKGLVFKLSEPR